MKINGIKICVSGDTEASQGGKDIYEKAKELGREIIRQKSTILTGATTGFSYWATIGAKELDGEVIGISPAASKEEHIHAYKLPTNNFDLIIYTGLGTSGRNVVLTRSSDAVIVGCGHSGGLSEFITAYEDGKPIGILEGTWQMDETVKSMIENGGNSKTRIIFDKDPKKLVEKVIELVVKTRY